MHILNLIILIIYIIIIKYLIYNKLVISFDILSCYFFYKFKIKNGLITSIFLINYGLSRIIIENFREPDFQLGLKFDFISQGQILSVPIVILGFIFLYLCQYKQR